MTRTFCRLWRCGSRSLAILGLAAVALAVAMPSSSLATSAYAASGIQVFVGYADTLRANPADFPTPWLGSPDLTFEGCSDRDCSFDSGAVRLVNTTAASLTVNSIVVKFDTCVYDIWPANTALGPGEQLVATQTRTGPSQGCTPDLGLMDSSDIGPGGANWLGNCNQSGLVPEVDLTVDGQLTTFADSGEVLNTGGVDSADCPTANNNESTQWTLIGQRPCHGSTLTLAPPTQTRPVTSQATVRATLRNGCGTPLEGASVHFAVQSGPNAGTQGDAVTNRRGVATFSYPGSTPGTDTVQASVTNPAGTMVSNAVTVVWRRVRMTGDAFGVEATGLASLAPTPEIGPVSTMSSSSDSTCLASITGPVSGTALCAAVTTDAGTATSTATASVQSASVGLAGLPVLTVGSVQTSSTSTCSGSTGGTTFAAARGASAATLVLRPRSRVSGAAPRATRIDLPEHPRPNTRLSALGFLVILDEELPVPGADQGLQVNGIHIIAPGHLDVVVASSTSDIHDC